MRHRQIATQERPPAPVGRDCQGTPQTRLKASRACSRQLSAHILGASWKDPCRRVLCTLLRKTANGRRHKLAKAPMGPEAKETAVCGRAKATRSRVQRGQFEDYAPRRPAFRAT